VRVGQRGGHKEFEVRVIWHILFSHLNSVAGPRLDDLHLQDRFKRGIKLYANVFEEYPFAKLDAVFEISDKRWMRWLVRLKLISLAHDLNKLVGLGLRINHEGPSARAEHDNAVFN